jgi:hypothetical protein
MLLINPALGKVAVEWSGGRTDAVPGVWESTDLLAPRTKTDMTNPCYPFFRSSMRDMVANCALMGLGISWPGAGSRSVLAWPPKWRRSWLIWCWMGWTSSPPALALSPYASLGPTPKNPSIHVPPPLLGMVLTGRYADKDAVQNIHNRGRRPTSGRRTEACSRHFIA